MKGNKMRYEIIKGDITKCRVEAIVNAANNSLLGGGGVDGAIHRTAGSKLLDECRKLKGCKTGEAKITGAYDLPCKYVIHTVGPVWGGGDYGEDRLLGACYRNSLDLAVKYGIETIAFPSISTGVYRFPVDRAARIVSDEINIFLKTNNSVDMIYMICFDCITFESYRNAKDYLS